MEVISVVRPTRSSRKLRVTFDDGSSFSLYKTDTRKYGIEEGKEVDHELYARLIKEVFIPRARSRALHLLSIDRSEKELTDKLRGDGYPDQAVEDAVDYVKSYHYIDDRRMAENYVRIHQNEKSRTVIRMNLRKKGIDDSLIEEALASDQVETEDLIRHFLEKKHYVSEKADEKEKARIYRFLLSKGFSAKDIMKVL